MNPNSDKRVITVTHDFSRGIGKYRKNQNRFNGLRKQVKQ